MLWVLLRPAAVARAATASRSPRHLGSAACRITDARDANRGRHEHIWAARSPESNSSQRPSKSSSGSRRTPAPRTSHATCLLATHASVAASTASVVNSVRGGISRLMADGWRMLDVGRCRYGSDVCRRMSLPVSVIHRFRPLVGKGARVNVRCQHPCCTDLREMFAIQ